MRILREQDRVDEAVQRIEENLTATDGVRNPELYTMLAGLHQQEGRDELTRKALLRGLEEFPEDENLLYEYGLLLENGGDHAGALQVMEKIIELKPDHAAALNFVGYSWADDKVHLDKALDYIQRAIGLKPDNGYIRDSLGWVLFKQGDLPKAREVLKDAFEKRPDAEIAAHLGEVLWASGEREQALKIWREGLLQANDNETLLSTLKRLRVKP